MASDKEHSWNLRSFLNFFGHHPNKKNEADIVIEVYEKNNSDEISDYFENIEQDNFKEANNSEYKDLTDILCTKEVPTEPMFIDDYTYLNLNLIEWNYKTDSSKYSDKLKIVPTKLDEILERQDVVKGLYENEDYCNALKRTEDSLEETLGFVNAITGNWMGRKDVSFYKFCAYVNFLDFIQQAKNTSEIKNIPFINLKEIGESIEEYKIQDANKISEYFVPFVKGYKCEHDDENIFGHHFNLGRSSDMETFKEDKEKVKINKTKAVEYFSNLFKTFSSENKDIVNHKKLSSMYRHFEFFENREPLRKICSTINKDLENKFPVLRTIGNYFDNHHMPEKIFNLKHDLSFYREITNIMKNYEKKGLPITFPEILPMNKREIEIKKGSELYVASTIPLDKIQLNNISHGPYEHCFFITGPNGTAKTTYIRQVGQTYVLAMHGFPIIGTKAKISPIESICSLFDKSDSSTKKMGTYENQLRRLDEILSKTTPYSLVLLDEVDLGTEYSELKEATRITLESLSYRGSPSYITSHLHDIADEVSKGNFPKTINLASEVMKKDGEPHFTHKILRNKSEKSYGYLIREKVGFNRSKYKQSTI